MGPVVARLRAELRARWRAWGAIAFLIGIAAGVVLTTAAGARRTGSAYARFLDASHAADLLVSPNDTGTPTFYAALQRQPGASVVAPIIGYGVIAAQLRDRPFLFLASPDPRFGTTIERPKVTRGRMFRASQASEVVADVAAARLLHLHPGSRMRLFVSTTDEQAPDTAKDVTVDVRVVGIVATRDSIVPVNALASQPAMYGTPAFTRRFGPQYHGFDGAPVALAPGTSRSAFGHAAQQLARRFPETGGGLFVADEWEQAAKVEHAIRPQAVALGLFAALVALVAFFAIGQVVARQLFLASIDNGVLRSLGMSRRQLLAVALAEVAAVATVGAFVAVIVAIVASPLMPIGPARLAEPHPGIALDWTVFGIGCIVTIALLILAVSRAAWRAASPGPETAGTRAHRPSRLSRWTSTTGAPPSVTIGARHALDPGHGRTAVPVRSALAVTALAITAIAGSLTFGANLSRLVHTPRLYGQSWDITADAQFSVLPTDTIIARLRNDPTVDTWTFGEHANVTVGGLGVPGVALPPSQQPLLAPTVIEGRAAQHPSEIALGTKTLDRVHRHVGQSILVAIEDLGGQAAPRSKIRMRIVGRSVFPFFGRGSFTPSGLGVGAQIQRPATRGATPGSNFVLVKVRPGPKHDIQVAALARDLSRDKYCGLFNQCAVSTAIRPTDILNYARIQGTPIALAAALGFLAVGVIGAFLATSIRRRRRDFAILKTLGFSRGQVAATVAWQATALILLALVIGVPAGVALGRWVWTLFATNLGAAADPLTPLLAMTVAIPVALVIANALAAIAGMRARRLRPAEVFRSE